MSNRLVFKLTFVVCTLLLALITAAQDAGQIFQGPEIEEFLARANISGMKDIPEGVTLPKKASLGTVPNTSPSGKRLTKDQ